MTFYTKQGRRYIETTLAQTGAWGDQSLMVLCAFRYSLGRRTYMPGVCADWLIEQWPNFPEGTRKLIRRELDEEFARDDEARAEGEAYKPLGHDCDRATWERVRALWKEKT